MILIRINKKSEFVRCESCDKCKELIQKYKIKKVYYYNEELL